MYNTILSLHSGFAYVALLIILVAVINALIGFSSKNPFTAKDRRISLFGLIAAHIQLLIGMILWFVSPNGLDKIKAVGMGGMDPFSRLLAVEHPFINIIAIVLITIGWSRHKKLQDAAQFKSIAIFYGIGLVLLLSRLPWATWFA